MYEEIKWGRKKKWFKRKSIIVKTRRREVKYFSARVRCFAVISVIGGSLQLIIYYYYIYYVLHGFNRRTKNNIIHIAYIRDLF